MEQQFLANENRPISAPPSSTFEQEHLRVKRRSWKHYTVAAAMIGGSVLCASEGHDILKAANSDTSQQAPDAVKLGLGALWFAVASIGGLAGTVGMAPRFAKDQRSIEQIEAHQKNGSDFFRRSARKNVCRLQPDGQHETLDTALNRTRATMRFEFVEAAGMALIGGVYCFETATGQQSFVTGAAGSAFLVAATVQAVAGIRHAGDCLKIQKQRQAEPQ